MAKLHLLGNALINGSILFENLQLPALYIYGSGTTNPQKPLISHSPTFPGYGLFYSDDGDRFVMQSSPTDARPSLVVDLDSNWITVATGTPKPGYEVSVNGQIVAEELLIQDSGNWGLLSNVVTLSPAGNAAAVQAGSASKMALAAEHF